jgi:hypothetical protein
MLRLLITVESGEVLQSFITYNLMCQARCLCDKDSCPPIHTRV